VVQVIHMCMICGHIPRDCVVFYAIHMMTYYYSLFRLIVHVPHYYHHLQRWHIPMDNNASYWIIMHYQHQLKDGQRMIWGRASTKPTYRVGKWMISFRLCVHPNLEQSLFWYCYYHYYYSYQSIHDDESLGHLGSWPRVYGEGNEWWWCEELYILGCNESAVNFCTSLAINNPNIIRYTYTNEDTYRYNNITQPPSQCCY
jgi:hypothetical protein